MTSLVVDILENRDQYAIVTHTFRGRTRRDAEAVLRAHMGTDAFLRSAIERGEWRGIPLTVRSHWR